MVLEFDKVQKSFFDGEGEVTVLRKICFKLMPGETVALTGESGSGKSTILHIAAGLEPVTSGSVKVSGRDITNMGDTERATLRRTDISLVFQQFNLIPSLQVAANISFHAALAGRKDDEYVKSLVDAFNLSNYLRRYPESLSGGQQQRVAIARAMAMKPKLLLADEPTGNLDEATADEVLNQMLKLVAETGSALMIATHSSKVASRLDRELRLNGGILR